jgi:hypothetical protein
MGGQRAQAEFRQADKGLLQMSVVRHRRRMIKGMAKVQIFHNKY